MTFVTCNVCGAAHKRRAISTGKIVYCDRCKELVCSIHTQTVKRPDPMSWDRKPPLKELRFCRLCLAEEALTV